MQQQNQRGRCISKSRKDKRGISVHSSKKNESQKKEKDKKSNLIYRDYDSQQNLQHASPVKPNQTKFSQRKAQFSSQKTYQNLIQLNFQVHKKQKHCLQCQKARSKIETETQKNRKFTLIRKSSQQKYILEFDGACLECKTKLVNRASQKIQVPYSIIKV